MTGGKWLAMRGQDQRRMREEVREKGGRKRMRRKDRDGKKQNRTRIGN